MEKALATEGKNPKSEHSSAEDSYLSGGSAAAPVEDRLIQAYLQVVLRYKLFIFFVSVIVVAASVLATRAMPWRYQATATINIGAYIPPVQGPMAKYLEEQTSKWSYYENLFTLLKSNAIAKHVLTSNEEVRRFISGPRAESEGNSNYVPSTAEISRYLGHVSHEYIDGSTMVRISAKARYPLMAAILANAQAQAFIELTRAQRMSAVNINLEFLRKRIAETEKKLKEAETRLNEFNGQHSAALAHSGGDTESDRSRLQGLVADLGQSVLERVAIEAELSALNANGGKHNYNFSDGVRSKYLDLKRLKDEEGQIRKRIRSGSHPIRRNLRKQIERLQESIRLAAEANYHDVKRGVRAAKAREKFIRSEITRLEDLLQMRLEVNTQYRHLKEQHSSAKDVHADIAQRFEDALINAESEQQEVIVVDSALPPTYPFSPNPKFNFLLACFFGPVLGIAIAFLLDFFDSTMRTTQHLRQVLQLPILGVIPIFRKGTGLPFQRRREETYDDTDEIFSEPAPTTSTALSVNVSPRTAATPRRSHRDRLKALGEEGEAQRLPGQPRAPEETVVLSDQEFVVVTDPMSVESEAFRDVRTIVARSTGDAQVILVTSGRQHDGKTTVAANLAVSFAQMSEETVLVDADLRSSELHDYVNLPAETSGLTDYLSGKCYAEEIIHETSVRNLSLVLSGRANGHPADLIASKNMAELLEKLTSEYDRVIIDSASIANVADTLLLSGHVDGVILVVRSGKTPKQVAESAANRLRQVDAPLIGAIMNCVSRSSIDDEPEFYFVED